MLCLWIISEWLGCHFWTVCCGLCVLLCWRLSYLVSVGIAIRTGEGITGLHAGCASTTTNGSTNQQDSDPLWRDLHQESHLPSSNMAMENPLFLDVFPIKPPFWSGIFQLATFDYQWVAQPLEDSPTSAARTSAGCLGKNRRPRNPNICAWCNARKHTFIIGLI